MTKINSSHTRITHMYKHIYTCVFPDEKREGESDEGVYTLEGGGVLELLVMIIESCKKQSYDKSKTV